MGEARQLGQCAGQQRLPIGTVQLGTKSIVVALVGQPDLRDCWTLALISYGEFLGKIFELGVKLQQEPILLKSTTDQKA